MEITAQEMLTKDRISLRVTLTALRRIVDPERVVSALADVDGWLYRLIQFAIREAVSSRTLDEVLSAKGALDAELRASVRERIAETGIELLELGVKDVILPGEIRELVNKVVEAERTAKANLIRRQEETAATRSLLNTAKLMEDNPLLLRLKELELLERLVEKVGRIDLHAGEGQGLDALLNKLVRLKAGERRELEKKGRGRSCGPSHACSGAHLGARNAARRQEVHLVSGRAPHHLFRVAEIVQAGRTGRAACAPASPRTAHAPVCCRDCSSRARCRAACAPARRVRPSSTHRRDRDRTCPPACR